MTRRPVLTVRDDLVGLEPYVSPQQPARYRMNTNESPYPPPQALVEEIAGELREIALNRYPDRDARRLYDALSLHLEWPSEGLWVANGSNEVFMHLFLAFGGPGRGALLFEPTYSMHSLIPRIAGTEVTQLQRDEDLLVDLDRAVETTAERCPEVTIVCSPNNPTGASEPLTTIETLLEQSRGIVVVDEAYGEFADPNNSAKPLLKDHSNLVLTKTFSKAWRLAGVRIGYMLAHPDLVAELARVRLPYHLSAITQVIGEAAIRHAEETLELARAISEERDHIIVELQRMGVKSYPSDANFVLFEVEDPDTVFKNLLERDVLVRNYSGVEGVDDCLRVTAGLPDETKAFLAAMEQVLV
jgi:histidinol-phosphate aminotransferase